MSFKVVNRQQRTSKQKGSFYYYEAVDDMDLLHQSPPTLQSSTLALAHFLASTGPEEFSPVVKKNGSMSKTKQARILDRLRSRGSQNMAEEWVKYRKQSLRDSGVYSEVISDKKLPSYDSTLILSSTKGHTDLNLFPMPPTMMPPPLPQQQPPTTDRFRTDYQRQSIGKELVAAAAVPEVKESGSYTQSTGDRGRSSCPHCRQTLFSADKKHVRRRSCPPALAGSNSAPADQQAMLRHKIARLEAQLAQERQSRKRLEEVMCGRQRQ